MKKNIIVKKWENLVLQIFDFWYGMIYNKREYQEVQKSVETVAATAVGGITGATLLVVLGVLSSIALTLFSSKTANIWKKF